MVIKYFTSFSFKISHLDTLNHTSATLSKIHQFGFTDIKHLSVQFKKYFINNLFIFNFSEYFGEGVPNIAKSLRRKIGKIWA